MKTIGKLTDWRFTIPTLFIKGKKKWSGKQCSRSFKYETHKTKLRNEGKENNGMEKDIQKSGSPTQEKQFKWILVHKFYYPSYNIEMKTTLVTKPYKCEF